MVTLAVHPLVGRVLVVQRRVRGPDGRLYVDVRHPDGRGMRLPIEWTDLVIARSEAGVSGKATAGALAALQARLAILMDENVDGGTGTASSFNTEHTISERRVTTTPHQPASTVDDRTPRGGLGSARAPSAGSSDGGQR